MYSLHCSVCNKTFPMFSPWILGQIGHPMTVLKYACPEDSKIPPTCFIWLSFGRDNWGYRQWISFQRLTALQLFTDSLEIELCLQSWISQLMLHKIQRSGSVSVSSWQADSKTDPYLWIWWRIDWDIQGWRQGFISVESVKSWRAVSFWNAINCL